jgi:hypothetical protein
LRQRLLFERTAPGNFQQHAFHRFNVVSASLIPWPITIESDPCPARAPCSCVSCSR